MVRRDRGYTYLGLLFAVAILSAGLGVVGELWQTAMRRDKEAELIHAGNAYRRAIMLYYESSPRGRPQYPQRLEQLLKDDRHPGTRRYLRRLYIDPITGQQEWGAIRAPDGGIMGVHSLATAAPLKQSGFRPVDASLAGAASYADWKFFYQPPAAR